MTPVFASACSTSSSARSLMVGGVARQHVRRRDQLALGIDREMHLMPVETPPLALATVAHLRVMHRSHTIRTHSLFERSSTLPALYVLKQQPLQQKRRLMQPSTLGIVRRERLYYRLSGRRQQAIRIRNPAVQKYSPGLGVAPVNARLSFHRRAEVAPQAVLARPLLRVGAGSGGQCA
jgi:hypothetical protein